MDIEFEVVDYPPAKSEAISMLGPTHKHARRVIALLEAALDQAAADSFTGFGSASIGLELRVSCPRSGLRSDATNYLGGVGDVLESKGRRGQLDQLGDLAQVALYDNDRQIEEVHYQWEEAPTPSYWVKLWNLQESTAET